MIYTRTYIPSALDLSACTQCRRWCLPFPHQMSGICTICYYARERDAGRARIEPRDSPDDQPIVQEYTCSWDTYVPPPKTR